MAAPTPTGGFGVAAASSAKALPPAALSSAKGLPAAAASSSSALDRGRPATSASAVGTATGLGSTLREEVWTIVRAAIDEATSPLLARQRELEGRLEKAERALEAERALARARPHVGAASRLAALGPIGSIPVSVGPSSLPPPFVAQVSALPRIDGGPSAPLEQAPPNFTTPRLPRSTADIAAPAPMAAMASGTAPITTNVAAKAAAAIPSPPVAHAHRGSLPPTGYGVVVTTQQRPSLDLSAVGHVDVAEFDGGRRKRIVGYIVVVLMLGVIISVVTMAIVSHN